VAKQIENYKLTPHPIIIQLFRLRPLIYTYISDLQAYNATIASGYITMDNAKNYMQNRTQKLVEDYIGQFEEGYWAPLAMFASLVEEVGELAKEINHLEQVKIKKATDETELEMELGDVFFSLICIANHYGIDLENALTNAIDKYNTRDVERWTIKNKDK